MDVRSVNGVLLEGIGNLLDGESETMAEAMIGGYTVPSPGQVMGKKEKSKSKPASSSSMPGPLSSWSGQDWYYALEFSDEILYFRPLDWLKNGNVKGLMVTVVLGRRGAKKAAKKSVNKMDLGRWKPTPKKDIRPAAQKRFDAVL